MSVSVKFIVHKNLLPQMMSAIEPESIKAVQEYASDTLLPQARQNQAPHIDTGKLNESGHVENIVYGARVEFIGGAATGWTGLPRVYAKFHEEGTQFTGAYPFLVPAVDQTYQNAGERVAQAIAKLAGP